MKTTFIYALCEPENPERIRYVGKSNNPARRLRAHLSNTRKTSTHLGCWLKGLSTAPVLEVLDEVPETQWEFWEREYIRVFRAIGFNLVNLSEGGDGHHNPSSESREKNRRAHLGKKNPHIGVPRSPESRAKMSASRSGKNNWAFGKPKSLETRAKISATLRARKEGVII